MTTVIDEPKKDCVSIDVASDFISKDLRRLMRVLNGIKDYEPSIEYDYLEKQVYSRKLIVPFYSDFKLFKKELITAYEKLHLQMEEIETLIGKPVVCVRIIFKIDNPDYSMRGPKLVFEIKCIEQDKIK